MMINVLVAEDEPLILNSITKLIHSLDSDFIVCARAKNGLEVLQCLNSQPINIIFTDIKMPLLNGLDLIQEIRNRSLNVPIVILSGYNDFSYAKKALKLGVFDYLLKPIDPEELSNTLGKLKQLYANTVKEQQQHFFHQFAVGRTPSMPQMSLPQIKKMAVIILSSGCYPAYPFLFPLSALSIWKTVQLDKMLEQTLPSNMFFQSEPGILENEYFIFLFSTSDPNNIDELDYYISRFFRQINIFEYPIHLCYGICENSHDRIYETLLSLRALLMQRIPLHTPILLNAQFPPPAISTQKYTAAINNLITLSNNNEPLLARKIVELISSLHHEQAPAYMICTILQQLFYYQYLKNNGGSYDIFQQMNVDLDEEITNSRSLEELQSTIQSFFSSFTLDTAETGSKNNNSRKVEKYILENFRNSISAADLSREFGFDASYLSRQFKEQVGMTPWRFILNLKLEEAQRLLLSHPDMLIKDIALEIGYNDPLYFSRIFKKYIGVYPSEYRDSGTA